VDNRQQQLSAWLDQVLASADFKLSIASADASFRRYFRVHLADKTLIAMDAPPAQEDSASFVKVATLLFDADLNVPEVIAQDLAQGFLLLSDLGDDTYFAKLNAENAPMLYGQATDALIKLQLVRSDGSLPNYDAAMLTREMQLFPDWYLAKHLNVTLTAEQHAVLHKTFDVLNQNILAQAQVLVHRDYHSRNLMLTAQNNPGILDFQDAVCGAITYDLVSLLKDAYIGWDEEQIIDWAVRYWQPAKKAGLPVPDDFSEFYRNFEWVGVQRHIKVLGIFARLSHRDGKNSYLQDMPLVMSYLRKTCERYAELRPMCKLLNQLQQSQPQVGYTF
jgi:aminoglycoside/choline kinase family phosphotransferase